MQRVERAAAPRVVKDALAEIERFSAKSLGARHALVPAPGGIDLADVPSAWTSVGPEVHATLPATAGGVSRLVLANDRDAWIEVTAIDVDEVAPLVVGGALVHVDPRPATTLVRAGYAHGFEELRVFRERADEHDAAYRIHFGPSLQSIRADEVRGIVEVVGTDGRPKFQTAPLTAFDHDGVALAPTLALASLGHGEAMLTVRLDARHAHYPVTLDPAWTASGTLPRVGRSNLALRVGTDVFFFAGTATTSPYGPLTAVDRFAPASGSGSTAGDMAAAGAFAYGAVLSGTAVIAYTQSSGTNSAPFIYNPTTGGSSFTGGWVAGCSGGIPAPIGGGRVIFIACDSTGKATQIYDSGSGTFSAGASSGIL